MAAPETTAVESTASDRVPLDAEGVWFGYDRTPVLEDVSIRVNAGEFVALVGPNGSGKSTLLRILLGMLHPERGQVRMFGTDPASFDERWRVGYVPQRPTLASEVPATVEEIVSSGRLTRRGWWRPLTLADRVAVSHAIESVGLGEMASKPVTTLSGGQQQRAFIARAFASEPELLVLDEPVAGIDAESQRRFSDSLAHLIKEHDAAVLLVSHELSAVAGIVDRVIVLKRRVQFDGTPSALMREGVSLGIHEADLPLWLEGLR